MIRSSPPEASRENTFSQETDSSQHRLPWTVQPAEPEREPTEETSLLPNDQGESSKKIRYSDDLESQRVGRRPLIQRFHAAGSKALCRSRAGAYTVTHPKTWNPQVIWRTGFVQPARVLPAVFLGLLLNILDALSYGMILFPLGQPVFGHMGSDGISMFYISTIISQLVFSGGGSIFKGAVGSEMIEVVPFMHKMAFTILNRVGDDDPKSVLATTVLAFAASSVLTGIVFFLMGACRLGSLIGFFPRHILIGCIGGVGFSW